MQEYREKNKEKLRAWSRDYRARNKERLNQYQREWIKANPAKRKITERRWAEKHPEKIRAKLAKRQALQRVYLLAWLERGCQDCAVADVRTLEFDHVPERGRKRFKLTAHLYKPWKSFYEEVAKCDVVCANCHAIRTYERLLLAGRLPFREALRFR